MISLIAYHFLDVVYLWTCLKNIRMVYKQSDIIVTAWWYYACWSSRYNPVVYCTAYLRFLLGIVMIWDARHKAMYIYTTIQLAYIYYHPLDSLVVQANKVKCMVKSRCSKVGFDSFLTLLKWIGSAWCMSYGHSAPDGIQFNTTLLSCTHDYISKSLMLYLLHLNAEGNMEWISLIYNHFFLNKHVPK